MRETRLTSIASLQIRYGHRGHFRRWLAVLQHECALAKAVAGLVRAGR